LSKAKIERLQDTEAAPARAWAIATAAWLVPGLGHLILGKWIRALLLFAVVFACFLGGLWMGGHLFALAGSEQGSSALLQIPPMIANLGSGLLYIVCWGIGFADDPAHAARATFEYGNTFLLIAGLLNYIAMLDAFDIAAGRKS
jgi:hypothetical protein